MNSNLEDEKDYHGQPVEHVVDGGAGEGSLELGSVPRLQIRGADPVGFYPDLKLEENPDPTSRKKPDSDPTLIFS